MKEKKESNLLKLLGTIVLHIAFTFYRLFVITKVWAYIAVNQFGLRQIDLWHAFAISFFFDFMVRYKPETKDEREDFVNFILTKFAVVSIGWLLAYWIFG